MNTDLNWKDYLAIGIELCGLLFCLAVGTALLITPALMYVRVIS